MFRFTRDSCYQFSSKTKIGQCEKGVDRVLATCQNVIDYGYVVDRLHCRWLLRYIIMFLSINMLFIFFVAVVDAEHVSLSIQGKNKDSIHGGCKASSFMESPSWTQNQWVEFVESLRVFWFWICCFLALSIFIALWLIFFFFLFIIIDQWHGLA